MSPVKPIYRVRFLEIYRTGSGCLLIGEMLDENHPKVEKGHRVATSKLKFIDFEDGFAITQNSIYFWEGMR